MTTMRAAAAELFELVECDILKQRLNFLPEPHGHGWLFLLVSARDGHHSYPTATSLASISVAV